MQVGTGLNLFFLGTSLVFRRFFWDRHLVFLFSSFFLLLKGGMDLESLKGMGCLNGISLSSLCLLLSRFDCVFVWNHLSLITTEIDMIFPRRNEPGRNETWNG